jgi:multimeric flavodoxin WrbA
MKLMFINGSPKAGGSASAEILKELQSYIPGHTVSECAFHAGGRLTPALIDEISEQDVLVFAFPLYVDGIPSHLLRVLVELEKELKSRPRERVAYAVVNAGFYEGRQCVNALDMMKLWCEKTGVRWGQGLGIGGGGMLAGLSNVPAGKGPKKNSSSALRELANAFWERKSGDNLFVTPNFPRFLYISGGNMGWRMQAKQNGLKIRDLSIQK